MARLSDAGAAWERQGGHGMPELRQGQLTARRLREGARHRQVSARLSHITPAQTHKRASEPEPDMPPTPSPSFALPSAASRAMARTQPLPTHPCSAIPRTAVTPRRLWPSRLDLRVKSLHQPAKALETPRHLHRKAKPLWRVS